MNPKRCGRPALRTTFREGISIILSRYPHPVTVQAIRKAMLKTFARPCSQGTIKKYLDELISEKIVVRQLPAGKKRSGQSALYCLRGYRERLAKDFSDDF